MNQEIKQDRPEGFGRAALHPVFGSGVDLVWSRDENGDLQTNVKWVVRHHSPSGLEVGYSGSGPADLALNAMAALHPIKGGEAERLFDGRCSREAWHLHQTFKFRFLVTADRQGGRIPWPEISLWLEEQGRELKDLSM